jgi:hypothetical protein
MIAPKVLTLFWRHRSTYKDRLIFVPIRILIVVYCRNYRGAYLQSATRKR